MPLPGGRRHEPSSLWTFPTEGVSGPSLSCSEFHSPAPMSRSSLQGHQHMVCPLKLLTSTPSGTEEKPRSREGKGQNKPHSNSNAELGLELDSPFLPLCGSMVDASHCLPYCPYPIPSLSTTSFPLFSDGRWRPPVLKEDKFLPQTK